MSFYLFSVFGTADSVRFPVNAVSVFLSDTNVYVFDGASFNCIKYSLKGAFVSSHSFYPEKVLSGCVDCYGRLFVVNIEGDVVLFENNKRRILEEFVGACKLDIEDGLLYVLKSSGHVSVYSLNDLSEIENFEFAFDGVLKDFAVYKDNVYFLVDNSLWKINLFSGEEKRIWKQIKSDFVVKLPKGEIGLVARTGEFFWKEKLLFKEEFNVKSVSGNGEYVAFLGENGKIKIYRVRKQ